jgi:hypothetical protein
MPLEFDDAIGLPPPIFDVSADTERHDVHRNAPAQRLYGVVLVPGELQPLLEAALDEDHPHYRIIISIRSPSDYPQCQS